MKFTSVLVSALAASTVSAFSVKESFNSLRHFVAREIGSSEHLPKNEAQKIPEPAKAPTTPSDKPSGTSASVSATSSAAAPSKAADKIVQAAEKLAEAPTKGSAKGDSTSLFGKTSDEPLTKAQKQELFKYIEENDTFAHIVYATMKSSEVFDETDGDKSSKVARSLKVAARHLSKYAIKKAIDLE